MNLLLLASHAVAEYDDLRMFTDLGFDCFAPGGYEVPSRSGEGIRPALPDAPHHPELVDAINRVRAERGEPGPAIDWGKAALPDEVIDWADAIIVHHFPDRWIGGQWERIKHKRVIWRTCGQSNPELEAYMAGFRPNLQIVRYSPAEERFFRPKGKWAGQDALIRFGKYPGDYGPWDGDGFDFCDGEVIGRTPEFQPHPVIGNVTQDLVARGDSCGYSFWKEATRGWHAVPAGKGSKEIGGLGTLSYEAMLGYLRYIRVYLYTGTRPASYTLGLIEAMMTGTPIVSIGAKAWGEDWGGTDLFEAAVDVRLNEALPGFRSIVAEDMCFDRPADANRMLGWMLAYPEKAEIISRHTRTRAVGLFGIDMIGQHWRSFLS